MKLQKTIKKSATVSGLGLHTGSVVNLTFRPAPENHGVVFVRTDIEGAPKIEADVSYVVDTSRGTTLEKNGVRIHTVEHVMSALVGLEIDNVIVEIDNAETPIMDGSAKYFVDALTEAEISEQTAEKDYFVVDSVISYTDPDQKIEIIAIPAPNIKCRL
jgi:UDP-3-O-[3-hydroxymyristoyl] N-acetylglucosamine deacetylase/3-hydroxyacyl-[acyl-carrier-protein] dehydratase